MSLRPLIEEQHSKPQAFLVSHSSLLVRELDNQLQQQQIATNTYYLPSASGDSSLYPHFPQEKNLGSITQLKVTKADYFFYLYPSLGAVNPAEYERFFRSLPPHCKLVIIDNFRYHSRLEQLKDNLKGKDYRLILLTDPFGPFVPPQITNPVLKALTQIFHNQNFELDYDGQKKLYPTYTDDIVKGIIKATFNSGTREQTFYLSTLEPLTQIDLANHLKSHSSDLLGFSPSLEYDPRPASDHQEPNLDKIASSQAQLNWTPDTDLDQALSQTIILTKERFSPLPTPKISPSSPPLQLQALKPLSPSHLNIPLELKKPMKLHPNIKLSPLKTTFLLFLLLFFLPPLMLYLSITRGVSLLNQSFTALEQGTQPQAQNLAQQSLHSLTTARNLLSLHRTILFFALQNSFSQYDRLLDVASRLDQMIITASNTTNQAQELYSIIIGQTQTDFNETNSNLKASLDTLYNQLSLIQASLDNLDLTSNVSVLNQLKPFSDKVPLMREQIKLGINLTGILPQLIGQDQPQTYLVLIQNNSELRPTGGFIPAISLVTFTKGKLTNIQTQDVYTADSQLNGEVIPPEAILTYLGEKNWYLRDSNWSPHFPSSALQAQWFLNKEINQTIDGVIGINLFVLNSLLEVTGPITIPGQNQPISSANIYEIVEYGSQFDFNNPTNQKNEILVSITDAIFTQLTAKQNQTIPLARALAQSLKTNQLTIYSNNPNTQAFLETNNWSGSLNNPPCPSRFNQQNCTSETFSLIEANIGINRSNYFLSRRLSHDINIGEQGQINHRITISYKNTAPNDSWPAGRYKTYTRLYAPLYSQPLDITLDGKTINPLSITPDLNLGLQEIAFTYEIPALTDATLNISLRSSQILNTLEPKATLAVNWEKQSGTTADPIQLNITHPSFITPSLINQPASIQSGNISLTNQFSQDLTFAAEFNRTP